HHPGRLLETAAETAVPASLLVGHVGGQYDAPPRRVRVGQQQPQRGPRGVRQRGVLEFLEVALGVPLTQRGRDGERLHRGRPDLSGRQRAGQDRQRGRQIDTHASPPLNRQSTIGRELDQQSWTSSWVGGGGGRCS